MDFLKKLEDVEQGKLAQGKEGEMISVRRREEDDLQRLCMVRREERQKSSET